MNRFYIKKNDEKIYLDGGSEIIIGEDSVTFTLSTLTDIAKIKSIFAGLVDLVIYTAIVQEDGRETDEMVYQYLPMFTKLFRIIYDTLSEKYSVVLIAPNNLEERVVELEDAVNYMLFNAEV